MAIGHGDDAPEPAKEPTAKETSRPGQRNVAKAERLLPMELRKRRRAAKLQVSAEKKARTSLDKAGVDHSPPKAERSPSKQNPSVKALHKEYQSTDQPADSTATTQPAASSPAKAESKLLLSPQTRKKSLPTIGASPSTRLRSLYTSSALARKKQKAQLPGANVPAHFRVSGIPMDIVPKTKLAILTSFPYPFSRLNSQTKKKALQSFVASNRSTTESRAEQWLQALNYFVYPAAPLPASLLLNRSSSSGTSEPLLGGLLGERKREEKMFLTTRWNAWQEAFRDLYMSFRHQRRCETSTEIPDNLFYVRTSEFVVCFKNNSTKMKNGDPESIFNLCRQHVQETIPSEQRAKDHGVIAVMSQSNGRIRKVLHHRNVPYSMPYITASRTKREVGEFHVLDEELKAFEASQTKNKTNAIASMAQPASTQENIHGADSLLLFHGHDAVHGLYEFLINRAPMSNQDVPEILALKPFVNGTIQSLKATSYGRVGGSASTSIPDDAESSGVALFRTEVVGFCFPSRVTRLLNVLKEEHAAMDDSCGEPLRAEATAGKHEVPADLRVYMEAIPGAERLNAVELDERFATSGENKSADLHAHQKRQHELEYSKRRIETVIIAKGETQYDVETSTRPLAARR